MLVKGYFGNGETLLFKEHSYECVHVYGRIRQLPFQEIRPGILRVGIGIEPLA